jgi:poly(A) polymerase
LTIIQREVKNAMGLSQEILAGRKPWKELFKKHTFFTQDYKYYISVISTSKDKEAHNKWSGFVESKVRILVGLLERHDSIALARAFNKGYERTHRVKSRAETDEVQNGSLKYVIDTTEVAAEKPKAESAVAGAEADPSTIVKEEGVSDNSANGDSASQDVKMENGVGGDSNPAETDLYTLTHYIGVELAEGM